ncbi:outer membrane beta-barrel protein [Kordia algicida OT-1]|uniref:Outer membrane protein beta-barrel domain-containing protein n=1 Tax=Kordia algicida OT-1 TaxID=391587 RepID=A9DT46_9FLAO|nr:outer membrane beta-barrel protein [Kordia algicida]EDP97023.1 hypothetical protein KAOT1_17708 [Kordia algicida OT-1]
MSDKKNIDQLFQDSFKDFEASPDPALWDKISEKLDAKEAEKDKKGIVFLPWLYRAAGIAAAIVLFFFIGNEFLNSDKTGIGTDEKVTTTTNDDSRDNDANRNITNSEQNSSNKQQNSSDNVLQNQERIANENKNGLDSDGNELKDGSDSSIQKGNALQNAVVNQDEINSNSNGNSKQSSNDRLQPNSIQNYNTINQENAVANSNSTQNNNSNAINGTTTNTSQNTVNGLDRFGNTVAQNNSSNNTNVTTNDVQNGENGAETNTNPVTNSNSTAVAQNNTTNSNSSNTNTSTNTDATTTETAVAEVKKDDPIKKSLLDEINDLYDLEKDKTDIAEATPKRWSISPNASPVYYNTLSNGSPIDETFADNSKTGDVNFSYGVNVGYDVNKRLTVRSGIHKVDYSYSTRDIALVPSIDGTDLTTIQFRGNNNSFDIKDRQAPSNVVFSQYQLPSTESSIREKQIEGNLNQRMSYIEVPVELKYALVDKKLGVNVIGGVSTLLLTENSIVLDSPEVFTEIGEATNVNDVSFSTNIGLGIDYKVSKQIEVNVEPMLKYQLNTFSGNTGNFKPYSVGVYTGVSFRF